MKKISLLFLSLFTFAMVSAGNLETEYCQKIIALFEKAISDVEASKTPTAFSDVATDVEKKANALGAEYQKKGLKEDAITSADGAKIDKVLERYGAAAAKKAAELTK